MAWSIYRDVIARNSLTRQSLLCVIAWCEGCDLESHLNIRHFWIMAWSIYRDVIARNSLTRQSLLCVIARSRATWQSHKKGSPYFLMDFISFYEIATLRSQWHSYSQKSLSILNEIATSLCSSQWHKKGDRPLFLQFPYEIATSLCSSQWHMS